MLRFRKIFLFTILCLTLLAGSFFGARFWDSKLHKGNSNTQEVSFNQPDPKELSNELKYYYEKSKQIGPKQNDSYSTSTVTFWSVGDVMLARTVAEKTRQSGRASWPFEKITDTLKNADFVFGNLESPTNGGENSVTGKDLKFNSPSSSLSGLVGAGFLVLNLANNHALDQDENGLRATIARLNELGLVHVGVGTSSDSAWKPKVVEKNGIKIGFIGASFSAYNDGGGSRNESVARTDEPLKLKSSIEEAKRLSDFVVVTMHAGEEYTTEPNETQKKFAKSAVDFGADLVIGAHPHWVQPVEKYKDKYIFYSLGNFVFDQMWSRETREGLIFKTTLEKRVNTMVKGASADFLQGNTERATLVKIELVPVVIDNFGQPRVANEAERTVIFNKASFNSAELK